MIKVCYLYPHSLSSNYLQDISSILANLCDKKVLSLTFFILPELYPYSKMLMDIKSLVSEKLGSHILVTLVPQKIATTDGIGIEVYEEDSEVMNCSTSIRYLEDGRCIHSQTFEFENCYVMCIEGIPSTFFGDTISKQSKFVFEEIRKMLAAEGFSLKDIVRQWNYIGHITHLTDGVQNYQEFNEVRSFFYQQVQWERGYPAATGIGIASEGLLISCIAIKAKNSKTDLIFPIDNPYQIAAHAYSEVVLKKGLLHNIVTTPKFERAKLINIGGHYVCFISGTAAIRGERSSISQSAYEQTIQAIENIQNLISQQNLKQQNCPLVDLYPSNFRIYIKREEDYPIIRNTIEELYPNLPVLYLLADVCREELLVEIEGIYQTK